MALSSSALKGMIISELKSQGFDTNGHSWHHKFAAAVSKAVVDHIQSSAQVPVTGGSSSGTYKVT